MEWVGIQWEGRLPFGSFGAPASGRLPDQPSRLQVLTALVYMNGGPMVHGWGVISSGGIYGTSGLDQDGALALIEMWAFVCGMLTATGDAEFDAFTGAMKTECARVAAIHEAERAVAVPAAPDPAG